MTENTYTPTVTPPARLEVSYGMLYQILYGETAMPERRSRFTLDLLPTAVQVLREEGDSSPWAKNAKLVLQAWLRDNPGATEAALEEALAAEADATLSA